MNRSDGRDTAQNIIPTDSQGGISTDINRNVNGMDRHWSEVTWIAFDTETTGRYPVGYEICELAAVKWRQGQEVDRFQSLIRPSRLMSDEVIAIHGITNEMVSQAPLIHEVLKSFWDFLSDGIALGHHAQFDMGFLARDFERIGLPLPSQPVVCTSLLSRKVLPKSPNHRLQTLVRHLNLESGQAHRALDDSLACLQVALKCFEVLGVNATLGQVFAAMGGRLEWPRYSLEQLCDNQNLLRLIRAIEQRCEVDLVYQGGSRSGRPRRLLPDGLVRNRDGDFLAAMDMDSGVIKRYHVERIARVDLAPS